MFDSQTDSTFLGDALNVEPVLLTTIKGTNLNKGRARTWLELEQSKLPASFARGERVEIEFYHDHITIKALPQGKRKVAGRERNGRTICILDICYPVEQRAAMFNGAERLAVWLYGDNTIRITKEV